MRNTQQSDQQLQTLRSIEVKVIERGSCLRIPTPSRAAAALRHALKIHLPEGIPHTDAPVVTRQKLPERRKSR
jgi:hypothetical protein